MAAATYTEQRPIAGQSIQVVRSETTHGPGFEGMLGALVDAQWKLDAVDVRMRNRDWTSDQAAQVEELLNNVRAATARVELMLDAAKRQIG